MDMAGKEASSLSRMGGSNAANGIVNGGKHAIIASLKRLEREARLLEEELKEMDELETSSAVCKELLHSVERKPDDPLLPRAVGLTNPSWERWTLGPQDLQGCGCCIL